MKTSWESMVLELQQMVTEFVETLLMRTSLQCENFAGVHGPGIATDGHKVCRKIIDVYKVTI